MLFTKSVRGGENSFNFCHEQFNSIAIGNGGNGTGCSEIEVATELSVSSTGCKTETGRVTEYHISGHIW